MKLSDIERPWLDTALRKAHIVLLLSRRFTSDDIHEAVTRFAGSPPHNNLWGVLLARLRNSGLIRRIGYTRSRRLAANGRTIAVWRSRV